jgi:predicted Rossmann fold nucleotide-binding protein DprA/Smf involved in DNA uptake
MLQERLGKSAPDNLFVLGNEDILRQPMIALICSVKCPGSVVIHTFDAVREMRDAGIVVVGGFHSPMEQECLEFLLRGKQPVVMSPAKGLGGLRLSSAQQQAIKENRMAVVSIFPETVTCTNKKQSQTRNEIVAALATSVLTPHASPGGSAESIARQAVERDQQLFAIDDPENENVFQMGAKSYNIEFLK